MGVFAVGDVVACAFPFSDLSDQKMRPAFVLAVAEYGDVILCQITSRSYSSNTAIRIRGEDFSMGILPIDSYVRPDKIFTADQSIIKKKLGCLKLPTQSRILDDVRSMFTDKSSDNE